MTIPAVRDTQRELFLDEERYEIATANQVSGARGWKGHVIGSQETSPEQEQAIALDFVNGGGMTFQGLPGTYEKVSGADGWDGSSPAGLTTWPLFSQGTTFTSIASHGWMLELGGSLYVFRGRYVQKYTISSTKGATWSIVSTFDLGSGMTLPGRPWKWRGKLYVPRVNGSGTLQRFYELTTQNAEVTEIQTLTMTGTPTGGTYTVTFDSKATAAIAYDADGPTLQAALRLIPGLEQVTVSTAGSSPDYTHTVTMTAAPAAVGTDSPPQFTANSASLTGGSSPTMTPATTTPGTADEWNLGPTELLARTFTVNHKGQLVGAFDTNEIRTCDDDDALTFANWAPNTTEGLTMGDAGYAINELIQLLHYTMALKEEGPFSFDESFYAQPELPDLAPVIDQQNGFGSSYSQGKILMPHRAGLVLWDQESFLFVGPNQEDRLEGARTSGWGRVSGSDVYGKYAFVAANDSQNTRAGIWSVAPGGDARPLIWQNHFQEGGYYEDVKVVAITEGAPAPAKTPGTWDSDNANGGTIDWSNESNGADADDSYASALVGTTKYLSGLNPNPGVPDDATITGVVVRVKKSMAAV